MLTFVQLFHFDYLIFTRQTTYTYLYMSQNIIHTINALRVLVQLYQFNCIPSLLSLWSKLFLEKILVLFDRLSCHGVVLLRTALVTRVDAVLQFSDCFQLLSAVVPCCKGDGYRLTLHCVGRPCVVKERLTVDQT